MDSFDWKLPEAASVKGTWTEVNGFNIIIHIYFLLK